MARRAKNEVGKRSKSKQLDKIVVAKVSFPSNTIVVSVLGITLPALALKWNKVRIPCQRNIGKIFFYSFLRQISCNNKRFQLSQSLKQPYKQKKLIATLWLLYQSKMPNCSENGNNHYFLANTAVTIANKSSY